MTSFSRATAVALVSGAFALASALASSTALAATFTLNLTGPASGTVGQTLTITATGNDPPNQGALYLEIDAIPTSLTTTCPSGYLNASQLASSNSAGAFVAFDEPENYDASGNFSNINGFTPNAAGQFIICGYTDDGAGDTLATASMLINVAAATPPPPTPPPPTPPPPTQPTPTVSKPVNTARPRVTHSGSTLRCSVGTWSNAPQHYSYRWLVGHQVKHGAHGSTLRHAHKLRGRKVQCSVTASNSAGSTTATSAAVKVR